MPAPIWQKAVLAASLGIIVSSCAATDGRSADSALLQTPEIQDLADGTWVADTINDANRELVPGTQITLVFTDDAISVNAGCNTAQGGAAIHDDDLVISTLGSTLKACDPALAEQDDWLNGFLASGPSIKRLNDDLWLTRDDTVVHLVRQTD